jgi:hypothetical protein
VIAVEKSREQLHARARRRDDTTLKSLLKNLNAGDGIEVKKNRKPHAREWHRKAVSYSLLRGRLYEAPIIVISALQQNLDSLTEVLLELRVVGLGISLRYFREPRPNPWDEKRCYNRRCVADIMKEHRIHNCIHRLAQGNGQFLSKDAIHGRRMLDGKAFEPGRKAVKLKGRITAGEFSFLFGQPFRPVRIFCLSGNPGEAKLPPD